MTLEEWRSNLLKAVEAQAEDETIWTKPHSVNEAYLLQSLRWLHRVIEQNDLNALKSIVDQSKGDI